MAAINASEVYTQMQLKEIVTDALGEYPLLEKVLSTYENISRVIGMTDVKAEFGTIEPSGSAAAKDLKGKQCIGLIETDVPEEILNSMMFQDQMYNVLTDATLRTIQTRIINGDGVTSIKGVKAATPIAKSMKNFKDFISLMDGFKESYKLTVAGSRTTFNKIVDMVSSTGSPTIIIDPIGSNRYLIGGIVEYDLVPDVAENIVVVGDFRKYLLNYASMQFLTDTSNTFRQGGTLYRNLAIVSGTPIIDEAFKTYQLTFE